MTDKLHRPFVLTIYPGWFNRADPGARIPPHRLVLEPLVAAANEIVVHRNSRHKFEIPLPPHVKRGNDCVLDRSPDLVANWPGFWNSGCWQRGSISIVVPVAAVDWVSLYSASEFCGTRSSRGELLKSYPLSAISYAEQTAKDGLAVFCLSASNGIEVMDVWTPAALCEGLAAQAQLTCRHFVRFVENGKFSREIVVDRPPYGEATPSSL